MKKFENTRCTRLVRDMVKELCEFIDSIQLTEEEKVKYEQIIEKFS